jgi:hypothetical protein
MVITKDGYPLAVPYVADTLNIAPGERYTVVVFAESPGTWVFHCHILTHVERDDGSVFGMFIALVVEPSDDPDVAADLSLKLGRDRTPSIRQDLIEAGPPSAAAASSDAAPSPHDGHDMEGMGDMPGMSHVPETSGST